MTWLDLPADESFGIDNLPYGVGAGPERDAGVWVRVGDRAIDVAALADRLGADDLRDAWRADSLNAFLALGRLAWTRGRELVTRALTDERLRGDVERHWVPVDRLTLRLPIEVADYVDFYASAHHASNVGLIVRPDSEPLTSNWRQMPLGYHGRAGTVVVSGTDIVRPCGQRKPRGVDAPVFGASRRLDIETEIGFVVGGATRQGSPVPVEAAADHLFGVVILNDWSARDIQAWESVPLGPHLGKSFATSVSPWVVTMDALDAAHVPLPGQDPQPLPYLLGSGPRDGTGPVHGLDIRCEVEWNGTVVSRPQARDMYWSAAQMLAHLTANGASLRDGDLFASGTVSGPERGSRGCFLELSWGGREPVTLAEGVTRTFLEDGDMVVIRASAPGPGGTVIGLGECVGTIRPAVG